MTRSFKKRTRSHTYKKIGNPSMTKGKYLGKRGRQKTKVGRFLMGEEAKERPYTHELDLVILKRGQIVEQILEALRVSVSHQFRKKGKRTYLLQVVPFPHEWLRKGHGLAIAKAERMRKGMRLSYGKVTSDRAARVKRNQIILKLWCYEKDLDLARNSLRIARNKMPFPCRVEVKTPPSSVPHLRKKIIEKEEVLPTRKIKAKKKEKRKPRREEKVMRGRSWG